MIKNIAKTTKVCPENKEINPVTGRCVLKCKEGTLRNTITGKCDKIPGENNAKKGRPKKKLSDKIHDHPDTPPKQIQKSSNSNKSSINKSSSSLSSSITSIVSSKSSSNKDFELYYPDLDDTNFASKISNNKEFLIHKIPDYPIINNEKDFNEVSNKLCGKFDKMLYQHFIGQFISYRTPYKSSLLYHGVGVGKTCSAITIAEALLSSQITTEPMIWVIMPQSLKNSFKSQVFNIDDFDTLEGLSNQCTDMNYIKLLNIYKSTFNKENKGVKEYR
jgi:hypothetical protein